MNITYEDSSLKDKEVISRYQDLWVKFAEDTMAHPDFPIPKSSKSDFFKRLKKMLKKSIKIRIFFIKDGDEDIGFAIADLQNKGHGWVRDMYLDKKYRSKGMADKNLQLTIDWLWKAGAIKIFLHAIPGRENFYKRNGFAIQFIGMTHKKSKKVWGGE